MLEETLTGPEVIGLIFSFLETTGGAPERFEKIAIRKEYGDTMIYKGALFLSFGNEKNFFVFSHGNSLDTSENYSKDILVARIDEKFFESINLTEKGPGNLVEMFADVIRTKEFISSSDFIEEGEMNKGLIGAFKDGRIVCSGILRQLCGEHRFAEYIEYTADGEGLWRPEIVGFFIENMADFLTSYIIAEKGKKHG